MTLKDLKSMCSMHIFPYQRIPSVLIKGIRLFKQPQPHFLTIEPHTLDEILHILDDTSPKMNTSPEKGLFQKENQSSSNHHFSGEMLLLVVFRGGKTVFHKLQRGTFQGSSSCWYQACLSTRGRWLGSWVDFRLSKHHHSHFRMPMFNSEFVVRGLVGGGSN